MADAWQSFLELSLQVQRGLHQAMSPAPLSGWRQLVEQERLALQSMPQGPDGIPAHIIPPALPQDPDAFIEPTSNVGSGNNNNNMIGFGDELDEDAEFARAIQASMNESPASAEGLREQQDRAYLEGLREDRMREQRRQQEAEELEMSRVLAESVAEERERFLRSMRDSVPPEPADEEPNVCKVAVRLPDGARLNRKFRASERIGTLRAWVTAKKLEDGFEGIPERFRVVMDYPRRVFDDDEQSLKDAGMFPRAAVIIEDAEDAK